MMSYEMVGVADQNNRTYKSKYGSYSKETGFVLNEFCRSLGKCELLDRMFHENCWSMKTKPKKMTKEEIEEALGYKIEIEDTEEKKLEDNKNISKNAQKTKNNVVSDDIFNFLFW